MPVSRRLLDLFGRDTVQSNVAEIVHIPLETEQFVQHAGSIYANRIYKQVGLPGRVEEVEGSSLTGSSIPSITYG